MRGIVHLVAIRLAAILIPALGAGCSTTVEVAFDEREDFSRYRTWDWAARAEPGVDAPYGDPRALDARVQGLIERDLLERGFERDARRPDFLVAYHLTLRRRAVVAVEPAAPYLLSSHNASASYWIEGASRTVRRVHEDLRLAIRFAEATGRRHIWRAVLLQTVVDASELPLDGAVATLLDRFPLSDARDATDAVEEAP